MSPDGSDVILRAKHVGKAFGAGARLVQAVQDVSLSVRRGEAVGIVGESGSGKSTLARLIIGLEAPDAGEIEIHGVDVSARGRRPRGVVRNVQMIFQDPFTSLNPRMKIGAAITEAPLAAKLITRQEREAAAREALEAVGLRPELARVRPHALSGGQRQRVAIARALSLEPSVLIADEAVSALDVSVQAQILNLLQRLRGERELTILFISHQLGAVAQLCHRVVVMCRGQIVEEGPVREIFAAPRHPYTRELLAAQPGGGPKTLIPSTTAC
ncbi:MAG TPA: ATP-binding cassette domain-containing protein [Solirubrobacterales bacterium]|nr:ATP-binding cassette domain-containing protein [Solirubrobacterales bacterium]